MGSGSNETLGAGLGVLAVDDAPGQVRELHAWLSEDPLVRRWVRLVEREPPPGALGPMAEAVQVVTGSPGVVAAVAGVLIAWLRYRTSDVTVKVRRTDDDTEVEVSAQRVRTLNAEQTQALAAQIEAALKDGSPPAEGPRE
jgi:hypothetical protein